MNDGVRFAEVEHELRAVYQLRYKIYIESMNRLMENGDHQLKELKDQYDDVARSIIAVKKQQAIGTLRIFWGGDADFDDYLQEAYSLSTFSGVLDNKQICIIERLMVDEKYRGTATTLRMYFKVMEFVLDHHVEAVLIDCEQHNISSYLKLGFRPYAETYEYPGIGPVVPMVLVTGDYEYLAGVGSPFAKLITEKELDHCFCVDGIKSLIEGRSNVVAFAKYYNERVSRVQNLETIQKETSLTSFNTRFKNRLTG